MNIKELLKHHGLIETYRGIKELSTITDVYVTKMSTGETYYTLEYPLSDDGVYVKFDFAYTGYLMFVENILLREQFITERYKISRQ